MNTVIKIENVYKAYQYGTIGHRLLYRDLQSWWAKFRGKEDPNSKIAEEQLFPNRSRSGSFWALEDVSLDVRQGEIVGIIGRNGAGKSTLLKILSRVTGPTKGQLKLKGRISSLLEVGTGFHPELTGRENIYLNGTILGMRKAEIDHKLDEIVEFAEIGQFLDTPVKRYSSGMYVRLAFAVAAHLEPEILIVDEVLAVGDVQFQKKCMGKMKDIGKSGRTILIVSHNMGSIHSLCNRCVLLDRGQVVSQGSPDDVIKKYVTLGLVERPQIIKPHNPDKPINFRRISLLDEQDQMNGEVRYDKGFKVVVEYEVNERVKDCCIWIGLRTLEDIAVLDTADTDVDENRIGVREPGYYQTIIEYPAGWINAGSYYLVAGIQRYSPVVTYDRLEVCSFNVMDIGTPEKLRTGNSRPGVLQPFLEWKTTKLETSPANR